MIFFAIKKKKGSAKKGGFGAKAINEEPAQLPLDKTLLRNSK